MQPTRQPYHQYAVWAEILHCDSVYVVIEEPQEAQVAVMATPQSVQTAKQAMTMMERPRPPMGMPQGATATGLQGQVSSGQASTAQASTAQPHQTEWVTRSA